LFVAAIAQKCQGFRRTRQGLRVYHSRQDERIDPRDRPYYWIGGEAPTGVPERGTDIEALAKGVISVTPLPLYLTAYHVLTNLSNWEFPGQSNKKILQPAGFHCLTRITLTKC
jgi:5'-nucleotidase